MHHRSSLVAHCVAIGFFLVFSLALSAQSGTTLTVRAESADLLPGPVYFDLPSGWADAGLFSLQAEDAEAPIYAQRWDDKRGVFLLPDTLPRGEARSYVLEKSNAEAPLRVEVIRNESRIQVRSGRHPIMTYHLETMMPQEGRPDYYKRSGFIHPVYSPAGRVLTDDFPVGHTHQHALFMAWVVTTFHGRDVDFWNQQDETGTVQHRRVLSTEEGPVFGRFAVEHAYVSFEGGDALREIWTVTAFPVGEEIVFDIRSEQTAASSEPLVIEAYHYGGLGFRGSARWNAVDSQRYEAPMEVLTSLGDAREAANHTRPRWTAAFGPLDGAWAGMAVLDHPANFRHPQPVRVHPEMPYFCQAPMVEGAFDIAPGETYVSNYRLVTFDGRPDASDLDRHWARWAEPATAEISLGN